MNKIRNKLKRSTRLKSALRKSKKESFKKPHNKIVGRKYLIVGNWKSAPETIIEARKNFRIIKSKKIDARKIIPVICPPLLFLVDLSKKYTGKVYKFATQNFYLNDGVPHTGETTLDQLVDLKVEYAIIGHAERREIGETNSLVAEKVKHSLDKNITPILCIGEKERDLKGEYLKFLEEQLIESLAKVQKSSLNKIVIAYEPVWAIGGNKSVGHEDIYTINIFIKKTLSSIYGRKEAFEVPILYGGSVDAENCNQILKSGKIDGLLIGRASSNPYSFSDVLKEVAKI